MKKSKTKKLAVAALFCAVAVVGSLFSFPVFGSKCSPVQHMVNVLCGVLLGPAYAVGAAFAASLIRNILGLGSLLAFPGSMFGAFLCGVIFKKTRSVIGAVIGEVFGTAVLGGLCAYPIAVMFMGKAGAGLAFYAYVFPFFVSTFVGAAVSGMIIIALEKTGALADMQASVNK